MKNYVKVAVLFITGISLSSIYSFSQTITADTTLANQYFDLARKYENDSSLDSAIFFAEKAKALDIKYFGEKSTKNASVLHLLGRLCYSKGKYDLALEYNFKALQIRKEILGEMHLDVAKSYHNIGLCYDDIGEYDKALENYLKASQISREVLGEKHLNVAASYNNIGLVYSNRHDYQKSLEYLLRALQIREEILGEKDPDVATTYNSIGIVYYKSGRFDKALEYSIKTLQIWRELFGEQHPYVAGSYNNVGAVYVEIGEYDKALEYLLKALKIDKEILGDQHPDVAMDYNNIGNCYLNKGEYDKSLECYITAFQIRKKILGENHPEVALCYANIGSAYYGKGEYDKALEYCFMALQIRKEISGEKNPDVAGSYNNIGVIYQEKGEYDKALEYDIKALQIVKEIFGEKYPDMIGISLNIGTVYQKKGENDKALKYFTDALQLGQEIFGEKHSNVAKSLCNIGVTYWDKGENDKALEYCSKALQIRKGILGDKHSDVAQNYNIIGVIYQNKSEYNKALEYYQKGIASCIRNFYDTANVYSVPVINNILDWNFLAGALQEKAEIFSNTRKILSGITFDDRKKIALRHYQACDTLIDITRRKISTQSDKLALGERASQIYKQAIDLLIPFQPADNAKFTKKIPGYDANLAFYFSEKNKSSVLLEALAGQEAQKYTGIPDNLLQKEHSLKIDIAFYTKKLAEPELLDSAQVVLCQDLLFRRNRSYDSLIVVFENQFPEYHNLKYNNKPATVKDIQNLLDKKTALISYFTGDSTITIFTLTRNNLTVHKVPGINNLNDSINWFRYGLTKFSPRMQENYRRLGFKLYQKLFPDASSLSREIENLYIIPDGSLATLPFESLLTENYTGDINAYKEYPYLVKKYNISYSYSANLFYLTFSKAASSTIEITKLNDWLAFAPVFDNSGDQNLSMSSRELQKQLSWLKTDSLMVNRSMFKRSYITPLPATETESEAIFKLFDENSLKAKVLLHNNANEHFIKSGALEQYKVLHFATHGFVNSERPELSGLLLAPDTTGGEDGVLYSGEIYNLKLSAKLVVLSACETGLGKIQKGEGIIGLTRALLYAGAKNIIVSLWQVADESTSDLMVDFYKNSLAGKGLFSYSAALRDAKLKMISEGKYAHPLFWSPFILIGK